MNFLLSIQNINFMFNKRYVFITLGVALLAVLTAFWSNQNTQPTSSSPVLKTEETEKIAQPVRQKAKSAFKVAPNIKMAGPDGKEYELYQVHKAVLIDFWASWCGPCRAENPNVVSVYKQFKDKGFTVFSVSLDMKKDAWEAAIKKDGLEWQYHVSDLQYWDNAAAREYGVEGIPVNYIIDSEGNILDQDLRGKALEKALTNYFK
jgi:thiol-disulfide isomerase/thioredoxin